MDDRGKNMAMGEVERMRIPDRIFFFSTVFFSFDNSYI